MKTDVLRLKLVFLMMGLPTWPIVTAIIAAFAGSALAKGLPMAALASPGVFWLILIAGFLYAGYQRKRLIAQGSFPVTVMDHQLIRVFGNDAFLAGDVSVLHALVAQAANSNERVIFTANLKGAGAFVAKAVAAICATQLVEFEWGGDGAPTPLGKCEYGISLAPANQYRLLAASSPSELQRMVNRLADRGCGDSGKQLWSCLHAAN